MELQRVEPRLFGKVPPFGLLASGLVLSVTGVALLAIANWVLGPLLLVVGLLLVALYSVAVRRLPPSRFARGAASGISRARDGLRFAGSSACAWAAAGRRTVPIRLELKRLRRERTAVQLDLGDAAYREDEAAVEALRKRMLALDEALIGCEERIRQARLEAQERVALARMPLRATEISRSEPAGSAGDRSTRPHTRPAG
jgi:hypothetical protein